MSEASAETAALLAAVARSDTTALDRLYQTTCAKVYGVVLRKGRLLTPQAKRFVNLLLSESPLSPNSPS